MHPTTAQPPSAYGAVMSLSASCVWRVQADLVNALDAQLGPPVDSYVNGTQTWLTEDGPGGVALEWRLHPVAEYRLAALRAAVCWVMQESVLFSATLGENLALASPGASGQKHVSRW